MTADVVQVTVSGETTVVQVSTPTAVPVISVNIDAPAVVQTSITTPPSIVVSAGVQGPPGVSGTGSTASTTAPTVHPEGTLWFDQISGRLFVYYGGWVDASPRGLGVNLGTKAANATGTAGQISYDTNYIYICVATNTWKRSPLTGGY
jgi:hypothetical protein